MCGTCAKYQDYYTTHYDNWGTNDYQREEVKRGQQIKFYPLPTNNTHSGIYMGDSVVLGVIL